ncbi:MAG: hypothetical protein IJE44_00230 [Clostridia bacterium]|nr:hypothetical protein [Clostridia bacterium]
MFNFSDWLKAGIIDGYKKGLTPFSKVTEITATYYSKGLISEEQAHEIMLACPIEE